MSYANLKKRRGKNIDKMVEAAENAGGDKKSYKDDRLWKLQRDKSGAGYAVIRFLPAKGEGELPWTRYWDHGFQGPGGQWYIEKSLTSIGKSDPVGELNGRLWNTGHDEDKETARKQKRRLHHVANIMVVNDPVNPENNGKIMLFEFGKKIFDKITDAMKPEFEDEKPMDPFDFWDGANFKLKARKVDGWVNYDKSEFESQSAISDDDDELEKIYNSLYDLKEFTDPEKYKSYDELKSRLDTVLGNTPGMTTRQEEQLGSETPPPVQKEQSAPQTAETMNFEESAPETESGTDDDTMDYFEKMAKMG